MVYRMIKEYKEYDGLLDIINSNIEKSKKEFGLVLRPEDEEKEKEVILSVFSEYKFKKWKEYSNSEYTKTFREVFNKIYNLLGDVSRYHYYNTPDGETKTRYNCHLECLISDLFRKAINEGIKWYKHGELEDDPNSSKIIEYDDYINDFLRNFLIDQNCYEEFILCAKRQKRIYDEKSFEVNWQNQTQGGGSIINSCLTWDNTQSGHSYWSRMNDIWQNYFKKNYKR